MNEPFTTPGFFWVDVFRVVTMAVATGLLVGIVVLAIGLRNTRQWGCYNVALTSLGTIIEDESRLGQPISLALFILAIAQIPGVIYVVKVLGKEDWKHAPHQHI